MTILQNQLELIDNDYISPPFNAITPQTFPTSTPWGRPLCSLEVLNHRKQVASNFNEAPWMWHHFFIDRSVTWNNDQWLDPTPPTPFGCHKGHDAAQGGSSYRWSAAGRGIKNWRGGNVLLQCWASNIVSIYVYDSRKLLIMWYPSCPGKRPSW